MQYEITKDGTSCAEGFTKNLCCDYRSKKVIRLPDAFVSKIQSFEQIT
jgi:acyl-CoA thioesterase FadM